MLPRLKRKSSSVLISEQIETKKDDRLPEKEAHSLLPQCQVALITSSSIINHTIDNLLQSARSCRAVVCWVPPHLLSPRSLLAWESPPYPESSSPVPERYCKSSVKEVGCSLLGRVSKRLACVSVQGDQMKRCFDKA
jgi:hypothetical protein